MQLTSFTSKQDGRCQERNTITVIPSWKMAWG